MWIVAPFSSTIAGKRESVLWKEGNEQRSVNLKCMH